jgi:hypothetical protein
VTLSVGNFMNHGHLRGNAQAFDLATLAMLSKILDNSKERSLLHYVLLLCKSKTPHAFQLSQQLRDLRAASKLNLEGVKQELRALHTDLADARHYCSSLSELQRAGSGVEVGHGEDAAGVAGAGVGRCARALDSFAFLAGAEEEAEAAGRLLLEVQAAYKALLIYLGKQEAEAERESATGACAELLGVLADFVADVDTEIRAHFSRLNALQEGEGRRGAGDAGVIGAAGATGATGATAGRIAPARLRRLRETGTVLDACVGKGSGGVCSGRPGAGGLVMHQQAALGASWLLRSLD